MVIRTNYKRQAEWELVPKSRPLRGDYTNWTQHLRTRDARTQGPEDLRTRDPRTQGPKDPRTQGPEDPES